MAQIKNAMITSFKKELLEMNNQEWITLCESTSITGLTFQHEVSPETLKLHLQGYAELNKRQRYKGWKKIFQDPALHIEQRKGTVQEAVDYCNKPATAVLNTQFLWGEFKESKQGERTDISTCLSMRKDGSTDIQIAEAYPGTWARYYKAIEKYGKLTSKEVILLKESQYFNGELRPWQQQLQQRLTLEPDDRTITWITDIIGGQGKTWFAKWCEHHMNAQLLQNGSTKDIAMAFKDKPIVIINLPRTPEEFINYSVMENIKDSRIWAPKYESEMKWIPKCHLLVLANQGPDLNKVSKDRWDLWELIDGVLQKSEYPMLF